MASGDVAIVRFRPDHREAFGALNYAWIRRYFNVEPSDRRALDDPEASVLAPGGRILMAEIDGRPVGTCALLRKSADTVELAKMAVDETCQGRGIGRKLGEAAIANAREMGAARVVLESNSRLAPALALYRRLGFRDACAGDSVYNRCDVQMELALDAG